MLGNLRAGAAAAAAAPSPAATGAAAAGTAAACAVASACTVAADAVAVVGADELEDGPLGLGPAADAAGDDTGLGIVG